MIYAIFKNRLQKYIFLKGTSQNKISFFEKYFEKMEKYSVGLQCKGVNMGIKIYTPQYKTLIYLSVTYFLLICL